MAIAKRAGECQIGFDSRALLLSGNHVIDGKCQARESLGQAAIFAGISRPFADQLFQRIVYAKLRLPDYAF
jgi:hypothetical protein